MSTSTMADILTPSGLPRDYESRAQRRTSASKSDRRNVAMPERAASVAAGAGLFLYGAMRRDPGALLAALGGSVLLYRGVTGHCPIYSSLDISTARHRQPTEEALSGCRGVHVEHSITIARPVNEVYRFWRQVENLPHFMTHLESVRDIDGTRSHWVAKGPMGKRIEWDAAIINEVEDKLIGWRSLEGSDVASAGSVHFEPAPGGRGTEVRVRLQYEPPGGRAGALVALLFGDEPSQQIAEDLRRLKQVLEAGEIATTEGQPSAQQSG